MTDSSQYQAVLADSPGAGDPDTASDVEGLGMSPVPDQPLDDERREGYAQCRARGLSGRAAEAEVGISHPTGCAWARLPEVVARVRWLRSQGTLPSEEDVLLAAFRSARAAEEAGQHKAAVDGYKWLHSAVRDYHAQRSRDSDAADPTEADLEMLSSGEGDLGDE